MKPWSHVDFEKLVQEVTQSQCGRAHVSICGGRCAESDLPTFLQEWPLAQIPYRICEYASEITFEKNTLPQNMVLLERARLFGEGGDLELRREGAAFVWRFVGPAGVQPPAGDYDAQDYWASHPQATFHQREETALLWGKRDGDKWADDRVGAARLNYPVPAEWQRVQVHYRTYSRAGRVEFIWYTRLSESKGADNG